MLMLPVLLIGHGTEQAIATWLVDVLLHGAAVGIAAGAALGWVTGRAFHRAHQRGLMEDYSMLTFSVALSLATLGTVSTIGGKGILGVFAAGIAFNLATTSREQEEEEHAQEGVGRLFLQPVFFLFGIMAPLGAWWELGAKGLAGGLLVLFFRRLPAFLAMHPLVRRSCSLADLAFLGWFGPLGVTTIYLALTAADHLEAPAIWHAASLLVAVSLVAHGMTATPFSRWYAAHEERGG
jgi:sodium/hydrogen antiporter